MRLARDVALQVGADFLFDLAIVGFLFGAGGGSPQLSLVNILSMTDARHLYQQFCVVDGVDDAVIADANTPLAVSALKFLAARRAGIGGEIFQARNDARDQFAGQFLKFLAALEVSATL